MKDKIFMILLGIIAVNLTIQTVKDVGLFPTAYVQDDVQKVQICNSGGACAEMNGVYDSSNQLRWALSVKERLPVTQL
jgi:hypothetical protein